jgi:AI-2 transport protein TqsA
MPGAPFLNLFLAVGLVLMTGWLLIVGQAILLPVVLAVIAVYVLTTAAEALGRVPGVRRLPLVLRHAIVLLCFTLAVVALALVVSVTVNQLVAVMPRYQQNLEDLLARISAVVGIENPTWDDIVQATLGSLNFQAILLRLLGNVTSLTFTLFLVVVYAGFLMAERGRFGAKLAAAFPQGDQAELTGRIVRDVNRKIGDYLAIKTAINVILGSISFVILWGMGVDFALFWAVVIALFNYIPYVGSIIGVTLPVILSLAQFGSLGTTAALGALLIAAQTYVGNILEPRLIGRQLNLSPVVVLLALSVWSSIWGLPGAILAIPLTAMIAIVCGAFGPTRFVAALLADEVEPPDPAARPREPSAERQS